MQGIPFPDIDPVALQLGPLAIRWYALAYIAGLVIGWRYALHLARCWHSPITREDIGDFIVWATVGIILGGRLGFVFFYDASRFAADPLAIFAVWTGGMSFHGGLLGVATATLLFCRRRRLPLLAFGDLVACSAPIGLFLGRLANFVNGELFGRVTNVPWGMIFPRGGPEPRHPSQLYEAGLEGLLLFLVIALLAHWSGAARRRGVLTAVFLVGYGIIRFALEFTRQPDGQLGLVIGPLSMGQVLSVPIVPTGLLLFAVAMRHPRVT